MSNENIEIKGARVHNLKNLSLTIRRNTLTVITGVSGSGKSSLAFDTLYAEGQRRYVESLSAYARQFLERMDKPEVDFIRGISPALAIQQRTLAKNPRSTVATVTELYDYYRLLFGRIGRTFCGQCGDPVRKDTVSDIVRQIMEYPEGTKLYLLFRIEVNEKNILLMNESGFNRIILNGSVTEFSEAVMKKIFRQKETEILVDRLTIHPDNSIRLADSVETAFHYGHGKMTVRLQDGRDLYFSNNYECNRCQISYPEPEPKLFSFNNPYGACPACQGFGNKIEIDLDLVIPDRNKTLREGAIRPWTTEGYADYQRRLVKHAGRYDIPLDVPVRELTAKAYQGILRGTKDYDGIYDFFDWLESKTYKMHIRILLSKYRGYVTCSDCGGSRLRKEALCVRIGERNLHEVHAMTIGEADRFFSGLELSSMDRDIARRVLEEIRKRLAYLRNVGLDYLTGDRLAATLSGGEAQRISLATALGSSLVGTLYILDEPSIGLHPRDNDKLITILKNLRNIGNTVIVVEHDRDMMEHADQIIDMGPGAGRLGGEIVVQGNISEILKHRTSLTGKYLSGQKTIAYPETRREATEWVEICGAAEHNLKNIDIRIPADIITCITGVSGSGKSTLVHDILYAGMMKQKGLWTSRTGKHQTITGAEKFSSVELVDQQPIGRTSRSNPVSYIKAFDIIRDLFADLPMSKVRGYKPGTFSFNVPGGRCETCEGAGEIQVEMQFLADVTLPCEDCKGLRFKKEVLEVHYQGKSIYDVLSMPVSEGLEFFRNHSRLVKKLSVLAEVGLGYLQMGQSATTLSGGEAQRVKLAAHLEEHRNGRTLYILDEPTTGLHFDDIAKLIHVFNRLIESGHTVLVIEHNPDVMLCADYIIDLGPEGGDRGGFLVTAGTPEHVMDHPGSYTGQFLKRHMKLYNNT